MIMPKIGAGLRPPSVAAIIRGEYDSNNNSHENNNDTLSWRV